MCCKTTLTVQIALSSDRTYSMCMYWDLVVIFKQRPKKEKRKVTCLVKDIIWSLSLWVEGESWALFEREEFRYFIQFIQKGAALECFSSSRSTNIKKSSVPQREEHLVMTPSVKLKNMCVDDSPYRRAAPCDPPSVAHPSDRCPAACEPLLPSWPGNPEPAGL